MENYHRRSKKRRENSFSVWGAWKKSTKRIVESSLMCFTDEANAHGHVILLFIVYHLWHGAEQYQIDNN